MKFSAAVEITGKVLKNPHFESLPEILSRDGISSEAFLNDFEKRFIILLSKHEADNDALKEESHHYILPAIAVYQTLKCYHSSPLAAFREMWLRGAEKGAAFLQKQSESDDFLQSWIRNVTPKNCNAGAFVFEIIHMTDQETEYHVKRCPYVDFCNDYGCPEIITVFCDSDDISFGNIHPRLIWGRTKTIGRGDPVCDFKYTLINDNKTNNHEGCI